MYHLITGGSSGLGFEIAKLLIKLDEHVIIIGRNVEKLEMARKKLQEISKNAHVLGYSLDISESEAVDAFIQTLETSEIQVKHVYNVAGSMYYGSVTEVNQEVLDDVLKSNLIGLILITSKMIEHLMKAPHDEKRIISVLSTAALSGKTNESLYNAAKWGARGFLEALRSELSDTPIEIINVYPGGMNTQFWNKMYSGYNTESFMDPEDVARNIVRVAMDRKVYVTDMTIQRPKQS